MTRLASHAACSRSSYVYALYIQPLVAAGARTAVLVAEKGSWACPAPGLDHCSHKLFKTGCNVLQTASWRAIPAPDVSPRHSTGSCCVLTLRCPHSWPLLAQASITGALTSWFATSCIPRTFSLAASLVVASLLPAFSGWPFSAPLYSNAEIN